MSGKAFDDYYRELGAMEHLLASELGCTDSCARDILYLRTRHRHTPELEAELIRLHNSGSPPNMMEFGVTAETQANLLKQALENLDIPLNKL